MIDTKKSYYLPKDTNELKNTMSYIDQCSISDSKITEEINGPIVEENYKCPCGDITIKQKSIITHTDHPERGSIEIIHMQSKSDGCVL